MNRSLVLSLKTKVFSLILIFVLVFVGFNYIHSNKGYSLSPGKRALYLSDNQAGAITDYQLYFEPNVTATVGSMVIEFCSNDPLPGTPCNAPIGFDILNSTLASQQGQTGFTYSTDSTTNRLILTRTPAVTAAGTQATYNFSGVKNPTNLGSYYVRLQALPTTDGTGSASDFGGIAFDISSNFKISALVPPVLTFCTGVTITGLNCDNAVGSYLDFGELSSQRTSSGSSQLLAYTNAQDGYFVTVDGPTLTSGSNIIQPLANNDVSRPGVAQFGMNLHSNSSPSVGNDPIGPGTAFAVTNYNQANFFRFNSGDTIISNPKPDDVRQYTASYILNVSPAQQPGVYVSTLTYICLASF